MATWSDVSNMAKMYGAEQKSETVWLFNIQGTDESRRQDVYVSYELMPPDFELIKISSLVATLEHVDPGEIFRNVGKFQIGNLGYSPGFEREGGQNDGFITIGTTIPLAIINISDPTFLLLYLHILADLADALEQQYSKYPPFDVF
ncbi:MAG: hypothetical protein ACRDRV_05495 [Pseudonocardiaceae bacterium]